MIISSKQQANMSHVMRKSSFAICRQQTQISLYIHAMRSFSLENLISRFHIQNLMYLFLPSCTTRFESNPIGIPTQAISGRSSYEQRHDITGLVFGGNFPTRSDTNCAIHSKKTARALKSQL